VRYVLEIVPFECNMEDMVDNILFEADTDNEAILMMCSLFYGYAYIDRFYLDFNLTPESETIKLLDYIDALNGTEDFDYFISLKDSSGKVLWKTNRDMEEVLEEDYM